MTEKPYLDFSPKSPSGEFLMDWWRRLEDHRGDRALLRRRRARAEVFFVPSFHRLYWGLLDLGRVNEESLATVAGLLSHVKVNLEGKSFPEQMGTPHGSEETKAPVSDLRFRRLLQARNHDELYPALIRVIRLLDGIVAIHSLAESVYYWNDRVRKDWAFKYYRVSPQ
jgi:CRISPR system Cascade subunit CasB